jgi:hypothetical protein
MSRHPNSKPKLQTNARLSFDFRGRVGAALPSASYTALVIRVRAVEPRFAVSTPRILCTLNRSCVIAKSNLHRD